MASVRCMFALTKATPSSKSTVALRLNTRRTKAFVTDQRRQSRNLPRTRGPLPCSAELGIFYSTSTGKTEEVADMIQQEMGTAAPQDIADVDVSMLTGYDGLVVGAPTWNTGADTERSGTGWDDVLSNISRLDLKGKPVAVFGLGDSVSYGEYFCDAMEEIYSTFKAAGAKMVGHWPAEGYQHEESKALLGDGHFCGLALDQDNEDDLTEERIKGWVAQLRKEGF